MQPLLPRPSPRPASAAANRILRDRQATTEDAVDNAVSTPAGGAARQLVRIIDNGSMPTAGNYYFAANPVDLGGTEVEGGAATSDVNTSQVVLVDVIGSQAPSVGDQLTAYAIGGRWVAERGSGAKPTQCCNWFCPNTLAVPSYIDVTDPKYGKFRLPMKRSGSQCSYNLAGVFAFQGSGSCPAGNVPFLMTISASGVFTIAFNNFQSDVCGNVPQIPPTGPLPPQTNCMDFLAPECADNMLWISCPTFDQSPVSDIDDGCLNNVVMELPCNGSNPYSASVTAYYPDPYCGSDYGNSNPSYLLYGGCPVVSRDFSQLTWTFQGGPPEDVGCACCATQCSPNPIPQKDLQLNWTSYAGAPSGTCTLHYGQSPGWVSDLFGTVAGLGEPGSWFVTLACESNQTVLSLYAGDTPDPQTGNLWCRSNFCVESGNVLPGCLSLTSSSANPYTFAVNNNFVPGVGAPCTYAGSDVVIKTLLVFDGSPINPNTSPMCVTVCVTGCGAPVEGVTVQVSGPATASALTDSTGCAHLYWQGSPGSYTVTVTADGQTLYSMAQTLACGGSITVTLKQIGCLIPPPATLTATFVGTISIDSSPPCNFTLTAPADYYEAIGYGCNTAGWASSPFASVEITCNGVPTDVGFVMALCGDCSAGNVACLGGSFPSVCVGVVTSICEPLSISIPFHFTTGNAGSNAEIVGTLTFTP